MSNQPASSPAPAAAWYVADSDNATCGPLTDFQLREGLLVGTWGKGARVARSTSGPWTAADDVRQRFLHLIEFGWYVRNQSDHQVGGPFAAEKMRRLTQFQDLSQVEVRSGRAGEWCAPDQFDSWEIPQPQVVPPESAGQPIQAKCRCPHCWHEFSPESVRWIASHTSLRGDNVAGPEVMRRFVGSNFDVDGDALDAAGEVCSALACPRCHLEIPRAVIELQPAFVSVVGAPACGKSYFLAASVEALQRRLAHHEMLFRDAQVDLNSVLSAYRRTLFWSDQPDAPVALPKTQPHGDLSQAVHLGGRDIWFPKPFMFRWMPSLEHPLFASRSSVGRVVCLYDNAGEHYLPGSIRSGNFATDHLRRSNALVFLFDPTQYPPLRPRLRQVSSDPQLSSPGRNYSQSQVLDEVLERVRRRRGVTGVDRISLPMIIGVTKLDVWEKLLEDGQGMPSDIELGQRNGRAAIDMDAISEISTRVRQWLRQSCPEIVHAAESQVENVYYVPTSSQGVSPEMNEKTKMLMVRPSALSPKLADAPMLLALHFAAPRLLPSTKGHGR